MNNNFEIEFGGEPYLNPMSQPHSPPVSDILSRKPCPGTFSPPKLLSPPGRPAADYIQSFCGFCEPGFSAVPPHLCAAFSDLVGHGWLLFAAELPGRHLRLRLRSGHLTLLLADHSPQVRSHTCSAVAPGPASMPAPRRHHQVVHPGRHLLHAPPQVPVP